MAATDQAAVQRLLKWAAGEPASPLAIELAVTERCNLRCRYCANRKRDNSRLGEVPTATFVELLQEAKSLGVEACRIPGSGEPLMKGREIIPLLHAVTEAGMQGSMTTNGTCFTEELLGALVATGWHCLDVSLDSHIAAIHDRHRGAGTQRRVIEMLQRLAALKRTAGSVAPRVALWAVVTKHNAASLSGLFALAPELGCSHVYLQPVIPYHWAGRRLMVKRPRLLAALRDELSQARELAERHGLSHNIDSIVAHYNLNEQPAVAAAPHPTSQRDLPFAALRCFLPWLQLAVSAQGLVSPCSLLHHDSFAYQPGNLEMIWYDRPFEGYRARMTQRSYPPECVNCCLGLSDDNRRLREGLNQAVARLTSFI